MFCIDLKRFQKFCFQLLNDWSHNITDLMGLVMKTTHLINKEEMVHKCMSSNNAKQIPAAK